MMRVKLAALLSFSLLTAAVNAQSQTLSYSLFSGDGPGNFNFDDNGLVQAITLDDGGTTVSGPITTLYEGGAGDTVFFFDHTSTGGTFVANNAAGEVRDEDNNAVGGVAPGDVVDVAVDEFNNYLFFTSRTSNQVFRAPLDPATKEVSGPATVFLDTFFASTVTSLHVTSGSRLLVGDSLGVSAVDPNNSSNVTFLAATNTEVRGLVEDVDNGFIYFSSDGADDVVRFPSAGGSTTVILDGSGTGPEGADPSFQDILVDTVNDRLLLANFAVDGGFDTDGQLLSYPLDRSTGVLTNDPAVLLTQDDLEFPDTQNAYFTGLQFVPFDLSPGVQGDANGDGAVDLLDLDILGANFGATPANISQGDFNGDNVVDLLDLDILGANFGVGTAAGVPEPTTPMLLAAAAVAAVRVRRRA